MAEIPATLSQGL
jgi:Tn3 transposase DDE domain